MQLERLEDRRVLALTDGLIGFWPFDGNGTDESGNDRHLQLYGGVGFAGGLFGQALEMNRNNGQYAARPISDPAFDFGTANLTIQAWVNFDSTTGTQVLIEKFDGTDGPGWTLVKLDSNMFRVTFGPRFMITSSLPVGTGVWHQFVLRRNGSLLHVFFDGLAVDGTAAAGAPIEGASRPLLIGKRNDGHNSNWALDGRIDEVAIWDRTLSDSEIATLYNSGAGTSLGHCESCADAYSVDEDGTLTVDAASGVLANDGPQFGEAISASVVLGPTHGTLALDADGSFTYTPAANYFGGDSFVYRITSNQREPREAGVAITVNARPDLPVVADDLYRTREGQVLNVNPVPPPPVDTTLVAAGTVWKYLDNGTDQGTAWRERDFDDSTWASGPAELGYGDGGEATRVDCGPAPGLECGTGFPNPQDKYITTYFRRAFTVDDPSRVAALAIELKRDDGAVVYINGREVLRDNMGGGAINYLTTAPQTLPDDGGVFVPFSNIDRTSLVSGQNVIAVEIHQESEQSSDISFDLRLNGMISPLPPIPGVLANDSDPDGGTLTAVLDSLPDFGNLTFNANGTFVYTPADDFSGADAFTYRARNATGDSPPATVEIIVIPAGNTPPMATADAYAVDEEGELTVPAATGLLANDSDAQGNPLSAVLVASPANGQLTLAADGSFAYRPNAGFFGTDTFRYFANDGFEDSPPATVTITVRLLSADFGDAPLPYWTTLAENGAVHRATGPTLGSSRDPEPDGTHSAAADHDTNDDGVTFGSIRAGQIGAAATVNVQNAPVGARLDAWIDFNADGSWGGPGEQIASGAAIVEGDNAIGFDVPSWAADGQTFARFRLSTAGSLGVVGGAVDGEVEDYAVTVVPPAAATGMFGGQKTISTAAAGARDVYGADLDGDGDLDVLSASWYDNKIAWYENNGSQTFTARTVSTTASGANSVFAADVDGDGDMDVLSASVFDDKIAWYENDGSQSFAAHTISTMADEAISVFAADVDGDGDVDVLSASFSDDKIAWYENNGSQTFTARTISTAADGANSVFATDVDEDGDIDVLSASRFDDKIAWYENNGSQSFTVHTISTLADAARSVFAADVDGDGDLDVLSASWYDDKIAWYENNGSQTFTARTISTTADGAQSVFAVDMDGDGDTDVLSASRYDDKIAWYENDGGQTFIARTISTAANVAWSAFAADVDNDGDMDVLSASIGDNKIAWYENENPLCTSCADVYSVDEDTALVVDAAAGVLANDAPQAGEILSASVHTSPSHAALTLAADGSFQYTPDANFNGTDTFRYSISSNQRPARTAEVTITINAVPDAPVAVDDAYSTEQGLPLVVNNSANGYVQAVLADSPVGYWRLGESAGSTAVDETGDHDGVYSGTIEFGRPGALAGNNDTSVRLDGTGGVATVAHHAALTPTLLSVEAWIRPDPAAGIYDAVLTKSSDTNWTDGYGLFYSGAGEITFYVNHFFSSAVSAPIVFDQWQHVVGTYDGNELRLYLDGALVSSRQLGAPIEHVPANLLLLQGEGSTSWAWTGSLDEIAVFGTVLTAQRVAAHYMAGAGSSGPGGLGVLANDRDADGDSLTADLVSGPTHGELSLSGDGTFTYTPEPQFLGFDSFTYRADDGTLNSNVATVTIEVRDVNSVPVAQDDAYVVDEDATLSIDAATGVLANDTDVEMGLLNAVLVTPPAHGALTLGPDGSFVYTPSANFFGTDTFTYRVSDGENDSPSATVTITINAVPDAPVAVDDAYTAESGVPLVVDGTVPPPESVFFDDFEDGTLADNWTFNSPGLDVAGGRARATQNGRNMTTIDPFTGDLRIEFDVERAGFEDHGCWDLAVGIFNRVGVLRFRGEGQDTIAIGNDTNAICTDGAITATGFGPDRGHVTLVYAGGVAELTFTNSDGNAITTQSTYVDDGLSHPLSIWMAAHASTPRFVDNVEVFSIEGGQVAVPVELVPFNSTWDYLHPTNGQDPAAGDPDFNTTWQVGGAGYNGPAFVPGTALFGYGQIDYGPIATDIGTPPFGSRYTAYFRRTFELTDDPSRVTGLTAEILADDGAVIYLNGQRVGTLNMPGGTAGNYFDTTGNTGSENQTSSITLDPAALMAGTNVLAVSVHNQSPNQSSDLGFEMRLDARITPEPEVAGVLANDTDAEGDSLFVELITPPADGTLTLNPDGTFEYTSDAGFVGLDTFQYRASDDDLPSNVATVRITVIPAMNRLPDAMDDTYSVDEDAVLTVDAAAGLLANDSDFEQHPITATVVAQPQHGSLTLNADGSFTYTPDANYFGADSFGYRASDGFADSGLAIVTLTIRPQPDAPVAVDDAYEVNEDTPLVVMGGPVGDVTLIPFGATWRYLDDGSDQGMAWRSPSFDDSSWPSGPAELGYGDNDEATVVVCDPNPGNGCQEGFGNDGDNYVTTYFRSSFTIDNASLVSGLRTTFRRDDGIAVYINGIEVARDNLAFDATAFTLAQNAQDDGQLLTPVLVQTDGLLESGVNHIAVEIHQTTTNSSDISFDLELVAQAQRIAGVLANDTDADGDTLTAERVSGPQNGTLTLNSDGTFTYTPNQDFFGTDMFTYRASDGTEFSAPAMVTIQVLSANQIPVAANDSFTTAEDVPLVVDLPGGLLANDTDGDGEPLSGRIVTQPAHGTLNWFANGTFKYTPAANYHGSDSFRYVANDSHFDSSPATVAITITPVNDAPAAQGDVYSISLDATLTTDPGTSPVGILLADSVAEFSSVQGQDHWEYGYYNRSADGGGMYQTSDFIRFPREVGPWSPTNYWNDSRLAWDWFNGDPPFTVITPAGATPNGTNTGAEHWTVRRWVSEVEGAVTITGRLAKDDGAGGSGIEGMIVVDGVSVYNRVIGGTDVTGVGYSVVANVNVGSAVDFIVAPNGSDSNDTTRFTASIRTDAVAPQTVFPRNATWRYRDDITNNSSYPVDAQGDRWTEADYDDATWPTGSGILGYGTIDGGPIATTMQFGGNAEDKRRTALFRRAFQVDEAERAASLVIDALIDDGASIYVNGVEVLRYNLPGSRGDGNIRPDTLAAIGGEGYLIASIDLTDFAGLLISGTNTVAVELHQSSPNSSDFGFDLNMAIVLGPVSSTPGALVNDADAEGNPMSASVVAGPFHGTLDFNDNGSFTYTPEAGFTGVDQFSYVARDATSASAPTRVTINVGGVNLPPAAAADRYRVTRGQPLTVSAAAGVLANDSDPNGDTLTTQVFASPANGTLLLNADGSFTYTPDDDFAGTDTFRYIAGDGQSQTTPTTVTLNVQPAVDPINSVPQAVLDRYQTAFDTPLTVSADGGVLANDSDAEEQPLTATVVTAPRHGTLELAADGSFVYRPLSGFHGTDSFTYRADDGNTAAAPAMVLVEVLAPGAAQSETTDWMYGDANRDGRVDAADVNFVLRHQFARLGMAAYDPAADIDGDGRVNIRDAVLVRNRIGSQPSAGAVIRMALAPTAVDSVLAAADDRQRLRARRAMIAKMPDSLAVDALPTTVSSATRIRARRR